ncbi:MAG: hypothetical protein M1829_004578 [Trizodia sp. TS-e1964]|nr:MAG: hypothetical protein M1829_004578 [Trizodia sp. TS-e1964]
MSKQIYFAVPKALVKSIKTAFESKQLLDKSQKISSIKLAGAEHASHCLVPTTVLLTEDSDHDFEELKTSILCDNGIANLASQISISAQLVTFPDPRGVGVNPLVKAALRWINSLPGELFASNEERSLLAEEFPKTYSFYHPMLLLPLTTFQTPRWQQLLKKIDPEQLQNLFKQISLPLGATHIARNARIPLLLNPAEDVDDASENTLRQPIDLQPLFGDFGNISSSAESPADSDFRKAFWVQAKQNGIYQTWAPIHTMFSRGNISEKARLLKLSSLRAPLLNPANSTAVDLYSGIGYYSFCYAAAGVRTVLCWELNPWSVEGARRGAKANGWQFLVATEANLELIREDAQGERKLMMFAEDNKLALGRVNRIRNQVPPIRHVNLGLLPTSRDSWVTAVEALDPRLGGWIHVHENIGVKDVEKTTVTIVQQFKHIAGKTASRAVECQHVERVKSFSPKVVHCVLDIWISGHSPN